MRLEGLRGGAIGTWPLVQPQPHEAPAAHHRQGGQFAGQPRGVAVDVSIGEQSHIERIVGPFRDPGGQLVGSLVDDAPVAAIDDGGADIGIRPRQEPLDVRPFLEDQLRSGAKTSPKASSPGCSWALAEGGVTAWASNRSVRVRTLPATGAASSAASASGRGLAK